MKTATVWRECLCVKHRRRAEIARVVLAITSFLVTLPLFALTALLIYSDFSRSGLLTLLAFFLGLWALVYLVYTYHFSYVAWYRHNSKMRRLGREDIEPVAFLVKKFPWLLLGRRNF